MNIRDTVFEEMYKSKITVYAMQKRLGESGYSVSPDAIYRWLNGKTNLNADAVSAICNILGLELKKKDQE
jgi:DNA-binding phage protein